MKGFALSKEDIYDILKMREKGLTLEKIAEKTGFSKATASRIVRQYKFYDGPLPEKVEKRPVVEVEQKKNAAPAVPSVPVVPTQERNGTAPNSPISDSSAKLTALKAFSSRQLIKELYDRGYRIEKDGLFVIEKKKVLVNDILNGV